MEMITIDYKLISNLEWDGIDHRDYPDFCDAHIVGGEYDGEEMPEEMIEELNENHREWLYDKLQEKLF